MQVQLEYTQKLDPPLLIRDLTPRPPPSPMKSQNIKFYQANEVVSVYSKSGAET